MIHPEPSCGMHLTVAEGMISGTGQLFSYVVVETTTHLRRREKETPCHSVKEAAQDQGILKACCWVHVQGRFEKVEKKRHYSEELGGFEMEMYIN